jgi:hypothetical protein
LWLVGVVPEARMDAREVSAEDVELEYVSAAGVRERGPLGRLWPVRFQSVRPERHFPAFRGQGNWCGWYWSATCGGHVGYESWLERDRLMLLDFDPLVTGISSQPFRLSWVGPDSKRVRHTPDFFVRHDDGTALVVDVRPDERIEPEDAAKFAVTAAASQSVGWGFARLGTPDADLMANVRWLATGIHGCTALTSPVAWWRCSPMAPVCWTGHGGWATRSRCCRCCSTCSGSRF